MEMTTIQVEKKVVDILQKIREYPKQPYNEIIKKMTKIFMKAEEIEESKIWRDASVQVMQELWDNDIDEEVWQNA